MPPAQQHPRRGIGRDGGRGGSRWLALAVLLCALAGGLYLRRSSATHAVEIDARSAAPPRAFELAPFPDDAPRRMSPPAAPPTETRSDSAAAPTAAPRERLALAGWVLEADGQGLGGAAVLVRGRQDPELSGKATSELDGRFALELDGVEWHIGDLANVHVSLANGERLFTGVVALAAEMTILLPRALLLQGRVEPPRTDLGAVFVRFDVPAGQRFGTNLFVGMTTLDDTGHFALAARPPAEAEAFLLTFLREKQPLACVLVPVRALLADEGARIELRLRRARLACQDAHGRPLEGVALGAALLDAPDAPRLTAVSPADGQLELLLPEGRLELCAGKEGFVPEVWEAESAALEQAGSTPVALDALDEAELLQGSVVAADGRPLEGAFVSVSPSSATNVGFEARVTALTAADGRFSVQVPRDEVLEVAADHPAHGDTQRTELPPGTREVRIRFEDQGKLTLELEAAPREAVARVGPIEMYLVDRKRVHVVRDHLWGSPTPLGTVPEGDYNVFAFWPGMDVCGASSVTVVAGEETRCHLVLLPARWLEGRVVERAGSPLAGASVQLGPGAWPDGPLQSWGHATSAENGSFRVLLGKPATSLELFVTAPDARRATWSGAAGPALVVLE